MPEEIAKDQRNGVEKVASTALANELIPVRQIPVAAAKYREADFSADVDGEPLGVILKKGFAKQCSDAIPRSVAVLRGVSGLHVQKAKSFPRHGAHSFRAFTGGLLVANL
jgi:hypothetical protein